MFWGSPYHKVVALIDMEELFGPPTNPCGLPGLTTSLPADFSHATQDTSMFRGSSGRLVALHLFFAGEFVSWRSFPQEKSAGASMCTARRGRDCCFRGTLFQVGLKESQGKPRKTTENQGKPRKTINSVSNPPSPNFDTIKPRKTHNCVGNHPPP